MRDKDLLCATCDQSTQAAVSLWGSGESCGTCRIAVLQRKLYLVLVDEEASKDGTSFAA